MNGLFTFEEGRVELNYMWLPTFVGMNSAFLADAQAHLNKELAGQVFVDAAPRILSTFIQFAEQRFPGVPVARVIREADAALRGGTHGPG